MVMWLFLLLILISSFLQVVFLPVNLVVLLVVGPGLAERENLAGVFLAGLIFDLVGGFALGLSCLVFLFLIIFIRFFRTGWYFWGVLALAVLGAVTLFSYFQTYSWQLRPGMITLGLSLAMLFFLRFLGGDFSKKESKLKV